MSVTYSIVCHETKQRCWIGQGADMRTFYSSEPETMERLGRFLQATIGKQLVVLCNDFEDYFPGYEDFEGGDDSPHSAPPDQQ
jgi:hypothetical protein